MLVHLSISNYILIDKLEMEFSTPFTVLTGETGAGKSVIMGALGLLLGQRADMAVLLDPERKCIIEGRFSIGKLGLEAFFEAHDLDFDEQTLIRREITPQGKSRALVNDTPVNLNVLKELGLRLVDIHSQHHTLLLRDSSFQLELLDTVASHPGLTGDYALAYESHGRLFSKLRKLEKEIAEANTEKDYLEFLYQEVESLSLTAGEQELLESERQVLQNSGEIKQAFLRGLEALEDGEANALSLIRSGITGLQQVEKFMPESAEWLARLSSVQVELKDLAGEFRQKEESIQPDEHRLQWIGERLDAIYRLQHKHHVRDVAELLLLQETWKQKLEGIETGGRMLDETRKELTAAAEELSKAAARLSESRQKAVPGMERKMTERLAILGMPKATFRVKQTPKDPAPDGADEVTFFFSANVGMPPGEVWRVASGGELSRLMLALKSMIAINSLLPTVVFDEIDAGVSGDIAGRVADMLLSVSSHMQVIAITHLPQIASRGTGHFKVTKNEAEGRTFTRIVKLSDVQRVEEIAELMSSSAKSEAALETARELLGMSGSNRN